MKHASAPIRDQSGSSLVEFAIAFPVLLILLFGALELNRYITVLQRVDKVAYTLADVITRTPAYDQAAGTGITETTLETLFGYFDDLMEPYPIDNALAGEGLVVITSVYEDANASTAPQIMWQASGGGTLPPGQAVSAITGQPVAGFRRLEPVNFSAEIRDALQSTQSLSNAGNLGMLQGENMLAVEVFYRYVPLFNDNFANVIDGSRLIVRRAYFNPRDANELLLNLGPNLCCVTP